jgi:hypothetical protein
LTDGTGVLLVATPQGGGHEHTIVLATASRTASAATSTGDGMLLGVLPGDLVDHQIALDFRVSSAKKKR